MPLDKDYIKELKNRVFKETVQRYELYLVLSFVEAFGDFLNSFQMPLKPHDTEMWSVSVIRRL